jgi:hypothetical protein
MNGISWLRTSHQFFGPSVLLPNHLGLRSLNVRSALNAVGPSGKRQRRNRRAEQGRAGLIACLVDMNEDRFHPSCRSNSAETADDGGPARADLI